MHDFKPYISRAGKTCAVIFTSCTLVFSVLLMGAHGMFLLVVYSALVFTYYGWTMLFNPFITDMFGNTFAGANVGFMSLYSTISSLASPVMVSLLVPFFAEKTNHIIGIAGGVLAVILVFILDTDTSKLKED